VNHKDTIKFDGKQITIEDLLNKKPNEVLVGLYIEVNSLNEKIKDVPDKVYNNSKSIAYIKGTLFVSLPLISAIIGYLALR